MKNLENYIRSVKDFPKPGIDFKDLTPLLLNPEAVALCLSALYSKIEGKQIDKVIGIESRGFFFGTLLAQKCNAGFIPLRKKGKLPHKTLQETFNLEYGTDVLEIHQDAIKPGEKILIHDDVLATGGTALAACNLVEQLGGEIVQCNFIVELGFLNGKEKISKYPIEAAIQY
ncbi:MAG: adenine phosphoribosyltransferase [Oceanihabitans sp.]